MNAARLLVRKSAMWLATTILVLSAAMLLGGCHQRKVIVLRGPGRQVGTHRGHARVVLVDRRGDRRHREEARHEHRDRRNPRRSDRHKDDQLRPRRR